MENQIGMLLNIYEKNFIGFQNKLQEIRETNPNKFVAFIDGNVFTSGTSIEDVKKELISKGIEPSGIVIEFVSKDEIHMIV